MEHCSIGAGLSADIAELPAPGSCMPEMDRPSKAAQHWAVSCRKCAANLAILVDVQAVQHKLLRQVSAPDEVVLRIPLPNNVVGGDQPQPECPPGVEDSWPSMLRKTFGTFASTATALGCRRHSFRIETLW